MPYCSLEEAWTPVSYPNSDIYGPDNQSIYKNQCAKPPKEKRMKSLARTNQRLAQHRGPVNRIPDYKNQVLKYGGSGNKNQRVVVDAEESVNNPVFNYDNQETPYTEYDTEYLYREETPVAPIHEIKLRKKKEALPRDFDSIDKIIADVEHTKENFSDNDETVDSNSMFKELSSELGDDKNIIKYLIQQNERLKALLKKGTDTKSKGVFNIWDFVIVLLLGIIMIIVLDYVYRIAVRKGT